MPKLFIFVLTIISSPEETNFGVTLTSMPKRYWALTKLINNKTDNKTARPPPNFHI